MSKKDPNLLVLIVLLVAIIGFVLTVTKTGDQTLTGQKGFTEKWFTKTQTTQTHSFANLISKPVTACVKELPKELKTKIKSCLSESKKRFQEIGLIKTRNLERTLTRQLQTLNNCITDIEGISTTQTNCVNNNLDIKRVVRDINIEAEEHEYNGAGGGGGGGGGNSQLLILEIEGRTVEGCPGFCNSIQDLYISEEEWEPGIGCLYTDALDGEWGETGQGELCDTDNGAEYCPQGVDNCWYSSHPAWDANYDEGSWDDATCCTMCGDGSIDGNEECDPGGSTYDPEENSYYPYEENLNGETCATQLGDSYIGDLHCNNDCSGYDTSECGLINGAPCTSDAQCTSNACNNDYDGSGTFCASANNKCVYDNPTGGNAEQYAIQNGYEQCSGDGYKTCNNGDWSEYNNCPVDSCSDDGDGTYSSHDWSCSSGTSGGCNEDMTNCGLYTCDGNQCRTSCSADSHCISGHSCNYYDNPFDGGWWSCLPNQDSPTEGTIFFEHGDVTADYNDANTVKIDLFSDTFELPSDVTIDDLVLSWTETFSGWEEQYGSDMYVKLKFSPPSTDNYYPYGSGFEDGLGVGYEDSGVSEEIQFFDSSCSNDRRDIYTESYASQGYICGCEDCNGWGWNMTLGVCSGYFGSVGDCGFLGDIDSQLTPGTYGIDVDILRFGLIGVGPDDWATISNFKICYLSCP